MCGALRGSPCGPTRAASWSASAVLVAGNWGSYLAAGGGDPTTRCIFTWVPILAMVLVRGAVRGRQLRAEALAARAELLEREQELRATRRWPRSAPGSPASCTTSSPTTSASWSFRPAPSATRWGRNKPSTREALASIEQAGRQALAEARRLLGMLRRNGRRREGLEPQPSVEHIDVLVEQVERRGAAGHARRRGRARGRCPPASTCAPTASSRRALTNALKHAGPAHAEVACATSRARLDVEVRDDGRGPARANGDGAGHGLIGMRERVALYGGALRGRARATAAASRSTRACRWREHARPHRRRPGAGPRRLSQAAGVGAGVEVVGEAADGREAVDQARRLRPSIVLMDIRMPRLDGIEATRRLDRAPTATPSASLILTTFGLDEYVYDALRAGASGFMLKDAPPEELLAAIEVVARGDALIAPAVTRSVIEEFVRRSPAHSRAPPLLDELTAARARGARAARARAVERRDRRAPRRQRRHGQDPRRPRARQAAACATACRR